MKPEFTTAGLVIQTYEEIFEELVMGYRSIYGSDISVDADDPDGQRIGIEANNILDLQSFAAYLYNSLDPDFAQGNFLDVICKYFGIFRRPASQSQWDLTVTLSKDSTLPDGYTIKDDLDQEWYVDGDEAVVTGDNTVTFKAVTYGAVEGLAGAAIEQSDYLPEVTGIAASADATVGIEEETDVELRIRFHKSLRMPSYTTTGGLLSRLLNIAGVTDCMVYENATNIYDSDLALSAHSIWVVIEGGAASTIVETIAKNKTGGCGLKGDEEGTYYEDIVRPDGITIQIPHTMNYDRPDYTDLYINLTVTRKLPTSPVIDHDAIKSALEDAEFHIGDQVLASELYEYVYNGGSNFVAYDLEISDDDIVYTDESLDSIPGGMYTVDAANITITEV